MSEGAGHCDGRTSTPITPGYPPDDLMLRYLAAFGPAVLTIQPFMAVPRAHTEALVEGGRLLWFAAPNAAHDIHIITPE